MKFMGMNYKIYENWYKYMSNVLNQIQDFSKTYGQSQASSVLQPADTFYDTLMKINTLRGLGSGEEQDGFRTESIWQDESESQSMDAIFAEAASQYGVPLSLLKAMGKAESGFDANAVSPAGAQGVMQLMPSTAKALGVEDPFDARSNIMGGAKYIAQKLRQYNGDVDLALAAYNAGSGNVAKYGGIPPFAETKNYIARIKGYMNSDLTIDKTVSVKAAGTEEAVSGKSVSDGGTYRLSQTDAQYFVDLMRLQMLCRASSLGGGLPIVRTNRIPSYFNGNKDEILEILTEGVADRLRTDLW